MANSMPRVCSPFLKFPYLNEGGTGIVFAVSDKIVVKTVWRFDNINEQWREQQEDSIVGLKKESMMYDVLAKPENLHPNIVLCFLHNPDYLFLERLPGTLYEQVSRTLPTKMTRCRWVYEISNAVAWLEKLEIAHGDLRPPNLLLDHNNTLKICDFDNACRYGQHIEGAHQPYYKWLGQDGFGIAGAASEQFAIGACAYFIHTGEDPDFTSEGLSAIEKFPIIGGVVRRCFDREYPSVMTLKQEIWLNMKEAEGVDLEKNDGNIMQPVEISDRVRECEECLKQCQYDEENDNEHPTTVEPL